MTRLPTLRYGCANELPSRFAAQRYSLPCTFPIVQWVHSSRERLANSSPTAREPECSASNFPCPSLLPLAVTFAARLGGLVETLNFASHASVYTETPPSH